MQSLTTAAAVVQVGIDEDTIRVFHAGTLVYTTPRIGDKTLIRHRYNEDTRPAG